MCADLEFADSPSAHGVTRLVARLWIPASLDTVFAFFAEPSNLEQLTPASLRFGIEQPGPLVMAEGLRIRYRLRVHGIPLKWESEIREWDPPNQFVDVQIRGPYRYWNHRHRFTEVDGGTLVVDEVDYAPPGGRLLDRIFIRRDLRRIFSFRMRHLVERFAVHGPRGCSTSPVPPPG
jgi:ligand-binding SRPBCC domain-containing protein